MKKNNQLFSHLLVLLVGILLTLPTTTWSQRTKALYFECKEICGNAVALEQMTRRYPEVGIHVMGRLLHAL